MTIREHYDSFSAEKRGAIIADIVAKGGCTPASAYMWLRGDRTPLPLYQKLIADVLRKHTGLSITATELFSKDGAQPAKP